jgi:hypothetical protein
LKLRLRLKFKPMPRETQPLSCSIVA